MKTKPETTKPVHDCVAQGHEITRMFGEAKKGRVEADCVCWTCTENPINVATGDFQPDWVEVWVVESVIEK